MAAKPKISFTFPIRWLKDPEDRKFLHQNLARMARGSKNTNIVGGELQSAISATSMFQFVPAFSVRIITHAYQPQSYIFAPKDAEKAMKDILPNAKCIGVDKRFKQSESGTSLPVMEFEVFY